MSNEAIEESGITIVPEDSSAFPKNEIVDEKCAICHGKDWIYTCPRCLIHTCSLPCVRMHKQETKCSGERDKTAYVPLKKYTESHMMSDYTYLEDVSRQSDNITRSRLHVDKNYKTKQAEAKQRFFAKTVNQLGIHYSGLPIGMSRNKLNQSNCSKKMNSVFWTLEIHFCKNDKRKRYLEHSFPGSRPLYAFFENLLLAENPVGKGGHQLIRHEVSEFIESGLDNFVVALKKEKSTRGHFVNMTDMLHVPFNEALRGETIIEYPILYIWLKNEAQPHEVIVLEEKKQLISVISEQETGPVHIDVQEDNPQDNPEDNPEEIESDGHGDNLEP